MLLSHYSLNNPNSSEVFNSTMMRGGAKSKRETKQNLNGASSTDLSREEKHTRGTPRLLFVHYIVTTIRWITSLQTDRAWILLGMAV